MTDASTAPAPGGSGVTPAAPTGTPAASGETTNSAPVATEAPKPARQRIAERVKGLRGAKAESERTDAAPTVDEQPGPAPDEDLQQKTETEREALDDTEAKKKGKGEDGDFVPTKVLVELRRKKNEQIQTLKQENANATLQVAKLQEALKLLEAENERIRQVAAQGQPLDERDEQIRAYELQMQAQEIAARLQQEHEAKLNEQAEQERQAEAEAEKRERQSRLRGQLRAELEAAVAKYPLVSQHELKVAWAKAQEASNDPIAAEAIAASLHEEKLAAAKRLLAPEKPPAPEVKAPGTSAPLSYSNDRRGMLQRIRAIRAGG